MDIEPANETTHDSPSRAPLWLVHGLSIFFVFMVAKFALALYLWTGGCNLGNGPKWLPVTWFHDDILASFLIMVCSLWVTLAMKGKGAREAMTAERLSRWLYMLTALYVAIQLPFSAWEQDSALSEMVYPSWSDFLALIDSQRGSYSFIGSAVCLLVAGLFPSLLGHFSQRLLIWFLASLFLALALLGPPSPQSETPRVLEDNPIAAFLRQRYNDWQETPSEEPIAPSVDGLADKPAS